MYISSSRRIGGRSHRLTLFLRSSRPRTGGRRRRSEGPAACERLVIKPGYIILAHLNQNCHGRLSQHCYGRLSRKPTDSKTSPSIYNGFGTKSGRKSAEHRHNKFRPDCLQLPSKGGGSAEEDRPAALRPSLAGRPVSVKTFEKHSGVQKTQKKRWPAGRPASAKRRKRRRSPK